MIKTTPIRKSSVSLKKISTPKMPGLSQAPISKITIPKVKKLKV